MERIKLGHRKILGRLMHASSSLLASKADRWNFYHQVLLKLPPHTQKPHRNLTITYPSQITDKIYSMFVKGTP